MPTPVSRIRDDLAVAFPAGDGDRAAGVGELDGVGQQVEHDPFELVAVALHDRDVLVDVGGDGQPGRLDRRADRLARRVDDVLDLHRADGERQGARLDPGEREQVLDEVEQAAAVAVDDADDLAFGRAEGAGVRVGEDLRVAADAGQRGAQLVGDGGDELALEPVELLQVAVGAGELRRLPLEGLLGAAAVGDIGDLVHDVVRALVPSPAARADERRRVLPPQRRAVGAAQPQLLADLLRLAGDEALHLVRDDRPVLLDDHVQQQLRGLQAGHAGQLLVDLQHVAVEVRDGHADRGVVERGAERLLRAALVGGEPLLRQGVLHRRAEPAQPVLEQVVHGAVAQGVDARLLAHGAADHDRRDVVAAGTQHVQRLQGVELRQRVVDEDHLGRARRILECGLEVHAGLDPLPHGREPGPPQLEHEHLGVVGVVLQEQDPHECESVRFRPSQYRPMLLTADMNCSMSTGLTM